MTDRRTTEDDPLGWLREELRSIREQSAQNGTNLAVMAEKQAALLRILEDAGKQKDKDHAGIEAACAGRHERVSKRVGRIEGAGLWVLFGVLGAAGWAVWKAVIPGVDK